MLSWAFLHISGRDLARVCPALAQGTCTNKQGAGGNARPGQTPDTARRASQARWKSKKSTFSKTFSTNRTSAAFGIREAGAAGSGPVGHLG